MTITLSDIRAAAEQLSNAHNDTSATAAHLQAEIKSAIGPILERYQTTLDRYAEAEAVWHRRLDELLASAPQLFVKPRSLSVDGVKAGYRKAEDTLDWDDEAVVIARIEALFPEQVDLLVRSQRSLNIDAVTLLEPAQRQRIGVRSISGADSHYISIGDNDVEKLAKLVIAAAASRQGEEEPARGKKAKARLKVAA